MKIDFFESDEQGIDSEVFINGRFVAYVSENETEAYQELHIFNNKLDRSYMNLIPISRWNSNERMKLRKESVEEFLLLGF